MQKLDCRRKNDNLASIIDVAIVYQEELGYPSAKMYLIEHGVDRSIIQRVLAVSAACRRTKVREASEADA